VLDHAAHDGQNANRPAVVGTYRLLRQPVAEEYGGFYTAAEFDIGALIARHSNLQFLELGRSCVLAPYRNKRTVELLWHGISGYLRQNRTDVMFGCASLDGTDPGSWRCRCRSCITTRTRRMSGARGRCPSATSR
jgi:putative hemolysin